ncbi:MAG: single-stranded-DNA-specific exonuclease RecJ [Firmicutes bacterium]|nr:single-stranded-DNA-specific exonuclease RecJ [Bacillota bacterium]
MNIEYARWQLTVGDPAKEAALCRALGISAAVARILVGRGIDTPEAAAGFFDFSWEKVPSPWLLADMEPAAYRLAEAVRSREPITVYGDYDVDGVTAAALLVKVIGELGGRAGYYIPHRAQEGYGLHREALAEIREDSRLVVTVDCGISAVSEVEYALEQGMELVITDHHQPGRELPKALAVVNPNRSDCSYPTKDLAGVGVAFKLAQAVARLITGSDQQGDELVKKYLDLVALGTVADVVPLLGENRILVRRGLENFGQGSVGLTALMEVAGLASQEISTGSLAFGLAPRINALGRLDDAAAAVRLLLTDDAPEARRLAELLDDANQKRRAIEDQVTQEAAAMVEAEVDLDKEWALVLASPNWHPGVIGIAASRLVERYHRPTILISLAEEPGKGSGRSIDGFHLHRALEALSHLFERFGGHKMAAGLTIRKEMIPELRRELNKLARSLLTEEDLVPKLRIDAQVTLDEIDTALLEDLERLAPFGVGNPQPVLAAKSLALRKSFTVGQDGSHLKLIVSGGGQGSCVGPEFAAVGFRMGDRLSLIEGAFQVDLAFQPKLNVWNGETSIELYVRDLRLPPQEARQRILVKSLQDYLRAHDAQRLAGWENMIPPSVPTSFPGKVFDWRGEGAKGGLFRELASKADGALIYTATPRYAAALAEQLAESPVYRGRVALYHGLMAPEDRLVLR